MVAPNWDAAAQEKYKTLAQLSIGLIVGTVVLLPGIVGLVHAPYVMQWAVPWMLGLSVVSVALLGLAMLLTMLGTSSPPFRLLGSGNWVGLSALLLLVVFILANMLSDSRAPPRILSMKVDPPLVEPGKYVELDVETVDEDGDALGYSWKFNGQVVSSRRNAYLKVPTLPGVFQVEVVVTDDRSEVKADASFEVETPVIAAPVTPPLPTAPTVQEQTKAPSIKRP